MRYKLIFLLFGLYFCFALSAQNKDIPRKTAGTFSLGSRSTISGFDSDGIGLGTGGQFRIQFSDRVNTDWFADYIVINANQNVRSEYYHIGWSVLFYPLDQRQYPKLFQPYILAGHCFDYNKKSLIRQPEVYRERWGSAVQAGLGAHFNLTKNFDLSLTCQYMIHLTDEIHLETHENHFHFSKHKHSILEGHLLTTLSLNYKLFRLWK